ncbi:MAG: hypothetical protein COA44_08915 [Arcobacter sp.]|nr:MAG: hypothetical protein COA44_08915 [Arcobacter sp.]
MKILFIYLFFTVLLYATPLHKAVQAINEEKVHSLINAGLDINAKDAHFKTPLHYAASIGRYSLVKYLVEHGANVHIKGINHKTALVYAIEKNRIKVIIYLSKKANEQKKLEEKDFLFESAEKGDLAYIAYAVSTGDINRKNKDGRTALHIAAEAGQFEAVAFLLRLGADKKLLDHDGRTALNYAKLSGNKELLELLLRYSHDTK